MTSREMNLAEQFLTLADFEVHAEKNMRPDLWGFVAGGAGDEISLRANTAAFDRILLRPRVLRDVSNLQMETSLFGLDLPFPILLAPTAYHRTLHPEGELATARGASTHGIPFVVSTNTTTAVDQISAVSAAPLWFQLYVQTDREFTRDIVARAEEAGCHALCVTVDTPTLGARIRQLRAGFKLPSELETPHVYDWALRNSVIGPCERKVVTWEDIDWLLSISKKPVLLKGILTPEDADEAVRRGVQGIVVSNHGGRNLDTVPAAIDALPDVVDCVAGRVPVLVDGGIRRGTDVFKCLALGAAAVLIGRPYMHGLAVAGAEGVARVVEILRSELEFAMILCGCARISQIDKSFLWRNKSSVLGTPF
jgi:4-hydroxymandelate oxidase